MKSTKLWAICIHGYVSGSCEEMAAENLQTMEPLLLQHDDDDQRTTGGSERWPELQLCGEQYSAEQGWELRCRPANSRTITI